MTYKEKSMKLVDMSVEQLKAMIYDESKKAQLCQQNIQVLEQELVNRAKQPQEEKKDA